MRFIDVSESFRDEKEDIIVFEYNKEICFK